MYLKLTHLCWVDSSTTTFGPVYFQQQGVWLVFITSVFFFLEIPVYIAKSGDPDQMLHTVASDLNLLCLPINLLHVSQLTCKIG